ncbi:MAG TPA: hypothetical protein VIF15_15765, partial [Polyangiaceae bacterium]
GIGTIAKCTLPSCKASIVVLAQGQAQPQSLAVDQDTVYWTNIVDPGTVMKCPIAGCLTPTMLADNQPTPAYIAVDGSRVYWTDGSGQVMSVAK